MPVPLLELRPHMRLLLRLRWQRRQNYLTFLRVTNQSLIQQDNLFSFPWSNMTNACLPATCSILFLVHYTSWGYIDFYFSCTCFTKLRGSDPTSAASSQWGQREQGEGQGQGQGERQRVVVGKAMLRMPILMTLCLQLLRSRRKGSKRAMAKVMLILQVAKANVERTVRTPRRWSLPRKRHLAKSVALMSPQQRWKLLWMVDQAEPSLSLNPRKLLPKGRNKLLSQSLRLRSSPPIRRVMKDQAFGVVDNVMTKLEAFRGDETKWSSLTALYQAMVGEQPSRQNDLVPKYSHYNLSMYWTKGRVGLLDKEKNHILSFSSASTQRIGLPLRATMLYVSCSPCLEHLWFSFGFGGVVWVPISVFNLWLDVNWN